MAIGKHGSREEAMCLGRGGQGGYLVDSTCRCHSKGRSQASRVMARGG